MGIIATVSDRDLPAFDCYHTLGVPMTASGVEIEAAFRAAAKREHPDLRADTAEATLRMQRLNIAREWLTDPVRRERYDATRGARQTGGTPADRFDAFPPGAWSTADEPLERRGSQAGPAMASVALMVLMTMLFIGSGSLVAAAIAVTAIVVLLLGVLLTILGAAR